MEKMLTAVYPGSFRSADARGARGFAISALVAATLMLVGCSGSPAAPGDVFSAGRRVQDGGGGGTLCPAGTCPGFEGQIVITAGGGQLTGKTTGANDDGIDTFRVTSTMDGSGRFSAGFIDLQVEGTTASVNNLWYSKGTQFYQDKGKRVTATVVQGRACMLDKDVFGVTIETTIQANFQNFGNTTIVEAHCVAVP